MNLTPSQLLAIFGIVIAFGGYFALVSHRHRKGREMIATKDKRLFPPDFEKFSAAERKGLYSRHSWSQTWDMTGKVYAGATVFGLVALGVALILYFLEQRPS